MAGKEMISRAVITRLPRYFRYLGELRCNRIERISSQELSELMGVTASQIRQDLNNFGGFGQQGYGYNVDHLYQEIGKLMGIDRAYRMIIMGEGNLERSIARYIREAWDGFTCVGLFDITGKQPIEEEHEIPVCPVEKLPEFIRKHKVDIAALAVPKARAVAAAKLLVDSGIRAIWNFTRVELKVPEHVHVENVHILDSLMLLTYKMNQGV